MNFYNIALEESRKLLSAQSGVIFFQQILDSLELEKDLDGFLPPKRRDRGLSSLEKLKNALFGFGCGAECLEDFDSLSAEPLLQRFFKTGLSSRSLGNFLRSFQNPHLAGFDDFLLESSLKLRQKLFPGESDFILSMDASDHEQYGLQMEGVTFGYKKFRCLNSQNCFDQFGFSYGFDLRPGNTHSSVGSELWVRKIFSKLPESMNRYFRADSAYAKKSMYNELINAGVKFAMPLRSNITQGLIRFNQNTLNWKKTSLYFFDSHDCEVAQGIYPIKDLAGGKKYLRVVFLRAPREAREDQMDLFGSDPYLYYCLVTNFEWSKSIEEIFRFYRGRANCENFIKDQKMGFDFYHFPCQKLSANRAWGLIGTLAYNFTRFLSFFIREGGCFTKRVRRTLFNIPCVVIRHARKVTLRFNPPDLEVMRRTKDKILSTECVVLFKRVSMPDL